MNGPEPRRKPEAFRLDDPDLVVLAEPAPGSPRQSRPGTANTPTPPAPGSSEAADQPLPPRMSSIATRSGRFRWGAILAAALSMLAGLAFTLSFASFISVALLRKDWIGWLAFTLLAIAAIALAVIILREIFGLLRLRRLGLRKRALAKALAERDTRAEQKSLRAILQNFDGRPELKWPIAALEEHAAGVNDPGDLARIADRDLMPHLDGEARRIVASAARRVSVVTALSPAALITVAWVMVENVRQLRALASLYGGRPGFLGSLRLARMVVVHIVATGGVALTDDLLGQFLGQDLVRRLSRRLGESVFNSALTARVGAAAIEVIRPLPHLATARIRARDLIADVVRSARRRSGTANEKNERPDRPDAEPHGDGS